MSEMIERVARAIWNIRREDEDRCDMELEDMGEDHPVWSEARAAIEAMREPTVEMKQVVSANWGRRTWSEYNDVIDAALKENA